MTDTIAHPKAEIGRRITYAYTGARPPQHPGVITGTTTTADGKLIVMARLDGQRSSLHMSADQPGLTYLDEIGPVPDLPMGRFQPGLQHPGIDWAYDGVIVIQFDEDDVAAITDDRCKAEAAVATFLREQCGMDDEAAISAEIGELKPQWVVFDWEPEGAECAWLMNVAAEGDEHAVHAFYLPTL